MREDGLTRRTILGGTAGTAVATLAGCLGSDDNEGDDGDNQHQELRREDWEGVSEIRLDGYTGGWVGREPDPIDGIQNPTLLLFAGDAYELTWENGDGIPHNIEIRDEDGDVVNRYRTERIGGRGETQTLEFEATEAMHAYVCAPHPRGMTGYIHVETE